ncbi:MAG: DNA polymerase III subunit delta [Candidatus Nealsonbacteria bacterium]|nr:DNA polymerase III subunit delta [Candidatus Nealsonbacteria bacterium]
MIIFLYGIDVYRSRQKLNEIVAHYQKTHQTGLNLKHFDFKESKFQNFIDEFQTVSMFEEKKLLILTNLFLGQEARESFPEQGEKFLKSKDIILILEKGEPDKRTRLFRFLEKNAKSQVFNFLQGEKLKNWARKEFSCYQKEISPEALDKLVYFVGRDLWRLSNEVRKLVNFKKKGKIRVQDIETLIKPEIEIDIFKTIDALATKNRKQAILLIHKHLEKGDNPLYLLSMISFQFRNLLIIKDLLEKGCPFYALAKETNFHPYVIKKTCVQAQKFSVQELKKIFQRIFQADLQIKTGQQSPEIALDLLIAEI